MIRAPAPPLDPSELLDVDVDQLTGTGTFVALGGLEPERPSLPIPIRARTPDTVEIAIASVSAISAPVIRSRLSAAITWTLRSSVRFATVHGAEQRSSSPLRPFGAVPDQPLARGAVTDPGRLGRQLSDHPASSTRPISNSRPFRLSLALDGMGGVCSV